MLGVIVKKELTRVFSDRRLVFSAFLMPAISIYILYSLMGNMIGSMSDDIDDHISQVAVINTSENFKEFLDQKEEQFGIHVIYEDSDKLSEAKEKIKSSTLDVLIVLEDGFDGAVEDYKDSAHPDIDTFYNPAEEYSLTAYNKVMYTVLTNYESILLSERFDGLDTLTAFTVNIDNMDNTIAEEGKEAGMGMSFMLPMLLNLMLFAGAMGIGIDVIAGEKERGTMATMLLAPVDRETIALGKVIGLGIVAVISALCTFGAIIASLPNASEFLAAGETVSLNSIAFSVTDYLMLLAIIIVQVGIFVGIICLLSVIAKSVKEAGTYISPVYMLVMISAFATVFTTGDVELYKFAIPILGNVYATKELLTFDLSMTEFLTSVGVSIVIVAILLKGITMAFNNERTMFNS